MLVVVSDAKIHSADFVAENRDIRRGTSFRIVLHLIFDVVLKCFGRFSIVHEILASMPVQLDNELMFFVDLIEKLYMVLFQPPASACSLLFAIGYENRMPSIDKKIEHSASRPIIGTKPTPTLATLFISIDSMPGLVQVDTELIQELMP